MSLLIMSRHARIDFDVLRRWNELTKRESHVYAYLVGCRNAKTGKCNPTRTQIAAGLGIELRDVWFGLNGLIAAGWIVEVNGNFEIIPIDKVSKKATFEVSKKASKGFQNGNVAKMETLPKRKVEVSKKADLVSKKESRRNIVFKQTKQTIKQILSSTEAADVKVSKKDDAKKVFEYWKVICNHPAAKFSPERERVILQRLKDFSVGDLFSAIEGCSKSDWHQGDNPGGVRYDDLVKNILKNTSQVEQMQDRNRPRLRVVKPGDIGRNDQNNDHCPDCKDSRWSDASETAPEVFAAGINAIACPTCRPLDYNWLIEDVKQKAATG